jgi:hypothetical protein
MFLSRSLLQFSEYRNSATGWMTVGSVPSWGSDGNFSFFNASEPVAGPQPPIQWVLGTLIKRPGREADHSSSSNFKFKSAWSYTSTPQYAFVA